MMQTRAQMIAEKNTDPMPMPALAPAESPVLVWGVDSSTPAGAVELNVELVVKLGIGSELELELEVELGFELGSGPRLEEDWLLEEVFGAAVCEAV